MSINPIVTNLHAAERVSTGKAARQLGRNMLQVARNSDHRLLQDHNALKTNSLIISSLILVLSRVLVADLSAQKAKGTPEGPLRYREAVRTTIREFCGWTFGYIILRWIQGMTQLAMRQYFGILDKHGNPVDLSLKGFKDRLAARWQESPILQSVRAALSRRDFKVPDVAVDPAQSEVFKYLREDRLVKLRPVLETIIPPLKKMTNPELMQGLFRWAPILVGSVPAVLLAGYALERFTRDHSDQVVDVISKRFGKGQGAQPEHAHGPVCNAQRNFDSYINRIQHKQIERGL